MGGEPRAAIAPRPAHRSRILVVEDEPRIRDLIVLYLRRAGFEVDAANDGATALARLDDAAPDLVIVDLMLPGLSGTALIAAIRETSDVPILVASARRADEDRIDAFGLGADDYVTKPFNPVEVVARVRAILRRARGPEVQAARRLSFAGARLVVDLATRRFTLDGRTGRLTPTEARLLAALAGARGAVVGRERLLALATRGVSETARTVDVHVANLRHKLGDDAARPWAIETVPDAGYRWIVPPDPRLATPDEEADGW